MGIFDKLVGAVNGPFKHFFSGNEEKARLKSRALKIVNELNVSGIKISLNRCLKNWTLKRYRRWMMKQPLNECIFFQSHSNAIQDF